MHSDTLPADAKVKIFSFHAAIGPRGPLPNQISYSLDEIVRLLGHPELAAQAKISQFGTNQYFPLISDFDVVPLAASQVGLATANSLWIYEYNSQPGFSEHEELKQQNFWGSVWTAIPQRVKHRVQNGDMRLVISSFHEPSTPESVRKLALSLRESMGSNPPPTILTSSFYKKSVLIRLREVTQVEIFTVPFFEAEALYLDRTRVRTALSQPSSKKERTKRFAMLNRRIDHYPHRVGIFLELLRRNRIKDGHVSMVWQDLSSPEITLRHRIEDLNRFPASSARDDLRDFGRHYFASGPQMLPLRLDVDFSPDASRQLETADHFSRELSPYYEDSYFSVVPEAYWQSGGPQELLAESMLTEKTFFAMLNFHPFLIVGEPHSLERLREYGYRTFSTWFDEGYDLIEDPTERILAIGEVVDSLCAMPELELHAMIQSMMPTLIHNRHRMSARVQESVARARNLVKMQNAGRVIGGGPRL